MNFFKDYFGLISEKIKQVDIDMLNQAVKLIQSTHATGGKVIIVGNGGSAAMASHVSVDLTNSAKIRAINFNEADLLTCFSNDYGYEYWVVKAMEYYADPKDLIILISSSGASKNILNAAKSIKQSGLKLITFSGFNENNSLRKMGDINFWVDNSAYNIVEMTHYVWLSALVDKTAESMKHSNRNTQK